MRRILCSLAFVLPAQAAREDLPKVLFVTHSAGFLHGVVKRPAADQLAHSEKLLIEGAKGRFDVRATQDLAEVAPENLAKYRAVVFYTTGELKIDAGGLVDYVKNGGGFVGIHCATDTLYQHKGYGDMIGGYFDGHPWHQKINVRVEDKTHAATKHLGDSFEIKDEIYQFRNYDRNAVKVLLSLDPASVDVTKGRRKDGDYALAWTRELGKGRVFYTALGHREEVWTDARFMTHLLEGIGWTLGKAEPKAAAAVDGEGFVPILDAAHSDGWKQAGPGGFKIEDGVATVQGGMGLHYYEKKKFRNYILKLEFRQKFINSNAGVFIRFPRVEGDPWIPVNEGYEIQIAGDKPGTHSTGSVYSFQAATEVPLKPAGEWNEYEIASIGHTIWVKLNGRLVNVYKGDRGSGSAGYVGFQNHDNKNDGKDLVSFRNVRVRELPDGARGFHVLFDGRDMKGWKQAGPGEFEIKDGTLTTKGGMGLLWHEQAFDNFLLLLDFKVGRRQDNSGVFVRFPDPGNDAWVAVNKGYEVQICDESGPKERTGSIYSLQDSTAQPSRPAGEWNHYAIQVVGQKYTVWLNGQKVNEFTGERELKGFVGLQNHDPDSIVSFRNVRAVSLPPERKR